MHRAQPNWVLGGRVNVSVFAHRIGLAMVFCPAVYGIVYPCTAEIARRVVAQAQPIKPTYYGRSAILPQHQLVVGVSTFLRSRTGHICAAEVDNL